MRALVLGGTAWLGRAIVGELLRTGADVTCLARGESGAVPAGARFVRADRRKTDAYDVVRGEWDEVIELSSEPDLVEPALTALTDSASHWTLVSTVSVYARNDEPDADESAALVEPADLAQYPDAKVHAERHAAGRVGSRLSIVRPGLIVGPGDQSDRFGYWPARLSRRGPALTPTTEGRFVQVIDARDLAAWIALAARSEHVGVTNAIGEPHPMGDFFRGVSEIAGYDGELVAVDDEALLANDVRYWAGPRSLPLWLPASDAGFARRSTATFHAVGGATRPIEHTVADVLADERCRGVNRERRSGLTSLEEQAVLSHARA
ncbi:MAG: reductase [Microbacterium sp.]|uniref:reductase n=1 Tax=unclassified Microbacterium TaxID=2609290 RepID=UPI000C5EAE16|nr:reductase [Microbacterium sp.]HAS32231.1 reductase [Microbacterium sp.]HBR87813.1 reductase [Microbacterium sp.]HBS73386.1 reductase [Microbacterium sp.]|tara:strand:- start:13478 stop:14440 length:963 start_codon:yes stop_codon:yes gene_type:complete